VYCHRCHHPIVAKATVVTIAVFDIHPFYIAAYCYNTVLVLYTIMTIDMNDDAVVDDGVAVHADPSCCCRLGIMLS
jgi:hypothetical protein